MSTKIFFTFLAALLLSTHLPTAFAQNPTPQFKDATGADNFKLLFISKAKTPPVIDGKAGEENWKAAEVITDFGPCEYGSQGFVVPRTEARYLWDDQYLYYSFTCYEDSAENMARHNRNVEDKSKLLYERDCVELHIDGNNDNATKFQVWLLDTREKQIFWYYDFGWGILVNENYGLSADWDYASSRGADYWQIEGRIALSHVQIEPRVGYIFGMNPTRFRFGMIGARENGEKVDGINQFLTWSTQGGDHQDARLYGKCILVNEAPASVGAGLKLAFPDLDKRTVMVQTGTGFDIFDHGRQSRQSYLEKLKEDLASAQAVASKLQGVLSADAPASVNISSYASNARPSLDQLGEIGKTINASSQISVAELNSYRKLLGTLSAGMDTQYWQVQRALLLAGAAPAVAVDLKTSVPAPEGRDEPENTPDPRTRKVPHVKWAKNFINGPVKALIITPEMASWGAYELQQRMDLDADIYSMTANIPVALGPTLDYFKEGILLFPQKKAQLQRLLLAKKYEAFIFLNCNPSMLPADIQFELTQRLVNGAAFVEFQTPESGFASTPGQAPAEDSELRKSIPFQHMTRLVTPTEWWSDHRGMGHDTLDRELGSLEVPPVRKRTVGKGRYYSFNPGGAGYWYTNPLIPHFSQAPDERFQAEYYMALDAKIILEAAGKFGPRRLLSIDCAAKPYPTGVKATAKAITDGPAFNGKLRVVVRDRFGRALTDTQSVVNLVAGKSEIALPLPALGTNSYYVDAWLLQNEKVVDWASQRFAVKNRATIKDILITKRNIEPNGQLQAKVSLANASATSTMRAEIRDVHKRVLQRVAGIKIQGGAATLNIPMRGASSLYHHLDVYAEDKGIVEDFATKTFYVNHTPQDDFTVLTDGGGVGEYGALRREVLRAYGVNLFENDNNSEEIIGDGLSLASRYWLTGSTNETGGSLASDVYHKQLAETFRHFTQTYAARGGTYVSTGDDSGVQSDFVETYPNWVMPLVHRFSQKYPAVGRAGDKYPEVPAEFYTARGLPSYGEYFRWLWATNLDQLKNMKLQPGDLDVFVAAFKDAYPTIKEFNRASGTAFASFESITADDIKKINPPFSPDVMGFQDWLQKKYVTVTALNAAWQTNVTSFETIAPVLVPTLTAEGKYAAALDKRAYLEDLFIRHMATASQAVHSVDPKIGTGQGAATFNNVIPDVLSHTDTYAPYLADVNFEIGRSMPHKWVGQTLGVYGGKAVKVPARRQQVWHILFSGGNFLWFWSASTGGLMGDLSTNPGRSGAMLETVHEMKQGIASSLLRGKRLHDGIAILHSRKSGHMDGVVKELSTQENSELSFQRVVEDQGMQYRYVTSQNIEAGVLGTGEFKVLILPYSQILSQAEIAAIEKFVRAGGTVMADFRAGTFSTDGKPLERGALDELFGITRTQARALPVRGELTITGLTAAQSTLPGIQADASIKAASAKVYGQIAGAPSLMVNSVGKGKAIFWNIGMGSYDFLLNNNRLGAAREAFGAMFAQAGVKSRFKVQAAGKPLPGVELAVFQRGTSQFLTAEKRSFEFEKYPLNAEIVLDKKYYVADMRSGRRLGLVDRIPVQFEGLSCHVWSLLPYNVTALNLGAPKVAKAGSKLKLDIALSTSAAPATHVVRVEATSPSGATPLEIQLLDTNSGKLSCILPLAFNEETGVWKVKVTDINTGLTRSAQVEVTQ